MVNSKAPSSAPLFLFLLLLPLFSDAQIPLQQSWKFATGDNPEYAMPDFDDSRWTAISVQENWEQQGFAEYNGYSWYRIRFRVPASMKTGTGLANALRIELGQIDDADAVYLNGQKIGQTGRFPDDPGGYASSWNKQRRYLPVFSDGVLPVRWDAENVLAVRVYDGDGPGGFFGDASRSFALAEVTDFIQLDGQLEQQGDSLQLVFTMKNRYHLPIEGTTNLQIAAGTGKKPLSTSTKTVQLTAGEEMRFAVGPGAGGRQIVTLSFTEKTTGKTLRSGRELPYILTPPESPQPRINNAAVYGARPGAPFLYTVAASGQRPMRFDAKGLPEGLRLDKQKGIISGTVTQRGTYRVLLEAVNSIGSASREVQFIIGDTICLTPPLGWNSWNCWGLSVSDARVRASAEAMVRSGLVNHGWTYMNIDDGWEAGRDAQTGDILCNEKFPDMRGLSDYLHSLGLKIGIYSSPGTLTCGGYTGSWQHEESDARTWARWGIDYLKYDWCSYGQIAPKKPGLADLQQPYQVMRKALDSTGRDIVYSLCQYGMGDVWQWGGEVGGNLWRTTGDITDTWESLYDIGFSQNKCAPYARPGQWNDPDMLIVGQVGWSDNLHPSRLTPTEQYTHISLWSLLSAPLLIGCDLARMDPFTYNLLANDEVLAINQDRAGKQAELCFERDGFQVWIKELADGSQAVGIFNLLEEDRKITLRWSDIGLKGHQKIRDVWRQQDVGSFGKIFRSEVYGHGVVLLKIY